MKKMFIGICLTALTLSIANAGVLRKYKGQVIKNKNTYRLHTNSKRKVIIENCGKWASSIQETLDTASFEPAKLQTAKVLSKVEVVVLDEDLEPKSPKCIQSIVIISE